MITHFVSKRLIIKGDTVASLVEEYRLSSWRAIRDIPANRAIRSRLPGSGRLPEGMMLSVAPNAKLLVKDRIHALHRLRGSMLKHFGAEIEAAESKLMADLLNQDGGESEAGIGAALESLGENTQQGIVLLAREAEPLVTVCTGMALTHVGDQDDRNSVGSAGDALCGLYWALTPPILRAWQDNWRSGQLPIKWRGRAPDESWTVARQHMQTMQSVVVQRIDQRLRDAQALERQLLNEL